MAPRCLAGFYAHFVVLLSYILNLFLHSLVSTEFPLDQCVRLPAGENQPGLTSVYSSSIPARAQLNTLYRNFTELSSDLFCSITVLTI